MNTPSAFTHPPQPGAAGRSRARLSPIRLRPSGYLMPTALAVVGILLTLMVAGIFQQQWGSRLRQLSVAQTEADLAVASSTSRLGMALQGQPVSTDDRTLVNPDLSFTSGMASLGAMDKDAVYVDVDGLSRPRTGVEAADIFGTAAPAGGYKKAATDGKVHGATRSDYPWITVASELPKSSRPEFAVFGNRTHESALHAGFPFAALAPQGSVKLTSVDSWSNPTVMEMKDRASQEAQKQYSGLPAWVGAQTSMEINQFRNGRAYLGSSSGGMKVGGGAVGYSGLPTSGNVTYEAKVMQDLDSAWAGMKTRSLDKTGIIWGAFDLSHLIQAIKGAEFPNLLTLEQALKFPFFAIPMVKNQGVYTELSFHVPYAPDQNLENVFDSWGETATMGDTMHDLSTATNEYNRMVKERDEKIALRNTKAADSDEYKSLTKEIDKLNTDISAKGDEKKGLEDKLTQKSEDRQNALRSATDTLNALPETQEDEKGITGLGYGGWKGFSYIMMVVKQASKITHFFDVIIGAIANSDNFDVDALLEVFYEPVRLVHLGSGRPAPARSEDMFKQIGMVDTEFRIDKTWTVPRGRTFRIQHDMKITGDLWVQKGGCMVVDGNLTLADPDAASSNALNMLKPQGRLILEEGATLVVGGDLTLAGTTYLGSMTVAGPVGQEHGISSSVLCKGTVTMPYGTVTGMSLDDLARGLEQELPQITGLSGALETLLTDVVPNVSKILGPFERRKCYFAKYQTTFFIPNIFPVPIPVPLPKKNKLCLLFQGMSMGYTASLNACLGDNLMTASDWWLVGHDVVPVPIKVDPFAMKDYVVTAANSIRALVGNPDQLEDLLGNLAKDVLNHIITDVAEKFFVSFLVDEVITHFLDGLVPFAGLVTMELVGDQIEEGITKLVDQVYGPIADSVTSAFDLEENGSMENLINKVQDKVNSATADVLLPESAGALVYGRNGINIGAGKIACGWFVSQGNITSLCNYTVGSMLSLRGNIEAKAVLFNPYFTKASIYLPRDLSADGITGGAGIQDLPGFWKNAAQWKYGKRMDGTIEAAKALKIGPNTAWVTAQGWSQK